MLNYSTPAIVLRHWDYGDADLIITLFTPDSGKVSVIAKHARRSKKRFPCILEPFSILDVVYKKTRGRLPLLQEAVLTRPFYNIRCDIQKTAYASLWAEMIYEWIETDENQFELYALFRYVLEELDQGAIPNEVLSIIFQMHFLRHWGLTPDFNHCSHCKTGIDNMTHTKVAFDYIKGQVLCKTCASDSANQLSLSKGTIKRLLWIISVDFAKDKRLRFSHQSLKESQHCLENFISYHLGKKLNSLTFLDQIRLLKPE